MEQGTTNQMPEMFPQPPFRVGINQYTWSAYRTLQDLNRPTVHDLGSAWQHMTLHPGSLMDTHLPAFRGRNRGRNQGSPDSSLACLWNVMSSPSTTWANLEEQVITPQEFPHTSKDPEHKRFTVTPTDIEKI